MPSQRMFVSVQDLTKALSLIPEWNENFFLPLLPKSFHIYLPTPVHYINQMYLEFSGRERIPQNYEADLLKSVLRHTALPQPLRETVCC